MILTLTAFALFIALILLFRKVERLEQRVSELQTDYEIERTEDRLSFEHDISDIRYEIEAFKNDKKRKVLKG